MKNLFSLKNTFTSGKKGVIRINNFEEFFFLKVSVINFVRLFLYFFAGSLYWHYRKNRQPDLKVLLLTFILFVTLRQTLFFETAALLFITTLVFWIGFYPKKILNNLLSGSDFSYGMYLYGYIIQNIIHKYSSFTTPLMVMIPVSISLAFLFAYFSWHYIESKALIIKRAF